MNRRVLFVDDEPNVLRALQRTLADNFEVTTADSGATAERIMATDEPFAVVVSDMRMPVMDGATLLGRLREQYPDTSRILLTGHADIDATLQAVNQGNIFRFLVKPCPEDQLANALEAGIGQYALVTSERDLLERTLAGAVAALTEVLSITDPALFNRATRLEQLVKSALDNLTLEPRWMFEMAARLSQLGCVALPREIVQRVNSGIGVSDRDRNLFDSHPETASRILKAIPRLEVVADVIRYQLSREVPKLERREISQGVELLRVAVIIDALQQKGLAREAAVEATLRRQNFDEQVVRAFLPREHQPPIEKGGTDRRAVNLSQLKVGMLLMEDVLSLSGAIVVPSGKEISPLALDRLRKFADGVGIVEPIIIAVHRK